MSCFKMDEEEKFKNKLLKKGVKLNWSIINIFIYLFLYFLIILQENLGIYPKPQVYNLAISAICGLFIGINIKSLGDNTTIPKPIYTKKKH